MAGQDLNGMWDPSGWISKANERGYTDEQGQRQSYNRGTKWQDYVNKKLYGNEDAKNYFYSAIKNAIGKDLDDIGLRDELRSIERTLRSKYNIKLDISHTMTDRQMAKMLRDIYPRAPKPASTPQAQAPQKPTAPQGAKGKQVENTNKGVAQAQPGDWIMRSNGQMHTLTMEDIKWAYKKVYGREYGTTQTPEQAAEQQKAMDAVRAQQSTPGTAQQRSTVAQQAAGASQAKQAAEQQKAMED